MDIERLSNICMDISTEWLDIPITYKNKRRKEKEVIIPLLYTGSNGIYVFINDEHKEDAKYIFEALSSLFSINNGLYLFFIEDIAENNESMYAYDADTERFLKFNNMYDAFDIFYYNHYIAQSKLPFYNFRIFEDYFKIHETEIDRELELEGDGPRYVKPIIPSQKEQYIEEKIIKILSSGSKKGKYTYYEDGSMTVNKIAGNANHWKTPWLSYTSDPKTYDFPCMEEDGDEFFLSSLLGGWFGLHKFRTGKIIQGLLYLISCGGCCIFYLIDMIAIMTGNYTVMNNHYFRGETGKVERAQTKVYNRPIKNKKLFLLYPIMALLSLCLLKYAYVPAISYGTEAFSNAMSQITTEIIINNTDFEGMTEETFGNYMNGNETK